MKRQTGITLGGMIFFLLLLSLAVYGASRIGPAYMDYWLVGKALNNLVDRPGIQSSSDESIREQFEKQLRFNNVNLADRSDLLIERIPGGVRLSVAFSAKRPFLGAVSLCMDFQAQASSSNPSGN
jgi:hypothetical protein